MQPDRAITPEMADAVVRRVAGSPVLQAELWSGGWPIIPAEILETDLLGEPARRCLMILWFWAGCKPNHVKCSAKFLAAAMSKDERRVRDYRNELHGAGFIRIVDPALDRSGRWVQWINDPAEANGERLRVASPGPQRYLAFRETHDDDGGFCAKIAVAQLPPDAAFFA